MHIDGLVQALEASFMGPTWGPPGADRTQVGPMWATRKLLSGICSTSSVLAMVILQSCTKPSILWTFIIYLTRSSQFSIVKHLERSWTSLWDITYKTIQSIWASAVSKSATDHLWWSLWQRLHALIRISISTAIKGYMDKIRQLFNTNASVSIHVEIKQFWWINVCEFWILDLNIDSPGHQQNSRPNILAWHIWTNM